MNEKLTLIEQKLLQKEQEMLVKELFKIHNDITLLFAKYPKIQGSHQEELSSFISSTIISCQENYFAGYTTGIGINAQPVLPKWLAKIMLEAVTEEFLKKIEEVSSVADGLAIIPNY